MEDYSISNGRRRVRLDLTKSLAHSLQYPIKWIIGSN